MTAPSVDKLWFLPKILRMTVRFFLPRRGLVKKLVSEVRTNRCDVLIIRTGVKFPPISKMRRACPEISICLEVNSAKFDESFQEVPFRSFFQWLEVLRFKKADAIVVVSSYLKTYLVQRGIPQQKIRVNQNGVNPIDTLPCCSESIKQQYQIPEDSFVIGYVGGMEAFRRLPEVVGYIADIRRAGNKDIYFMVVGDGKDMPAVQSAVDANRSALLDSVKLAGWQEHSEVPKFLATFNLAIFPFTNDYCSPLKLFEYLAAGIPAIGPDTSAVREVFDDGVHLSLVNQDGSDFVSTVLKLKADPQLMNELSSNGKKLVSQEYTWEKNAARVVSHIQDMHR